MKKTISISINEELHQKLKRLAKLHGMSISGYIRYVVLRDLGELK